MYNPGRGYRNEFRIIAGEWRRRRLKFPDLPGIRPSPDRVRETLFNWLRNVVPGARCLDLFTGSGALGLEALSRGAASVLFVDRERPVLEAIKAHLALLGASGGATWQGDALGFLRGAPQPLDLVFLDPPFDSPLLGSAIRALEQPGWLAPGAHVYMEWSARKALETPAGWDLLRQDRAGQVSYALARRAAAKLASD